MSETQLILDRIDMVRSDLKDDLLDVRDDVRAVEEQVKQTNGRLRSVEKWRAKIEGALWALGPLTGLGGVAVGVILTNTLT